MDYNKPNKIFHCFKIEKLPEGKQNVYNTNTLF